MGWTSKSYIRGHTGIDIGYGVMTEEVFNSQKSGRYLGNVIAAADGEILAKVSDQGDFCGKAYDANLRKAVLVITPNCTGGCAEGNCGGNYVVIDHDPTGTLDLVNLVGYRYTSYAHLQTNSNDHLNVGQFVNQGDQIGKIGSSGNSTGPHLHFEVLKEAFTPEDATENEDSVTQTWGINPAYESAIVDPFYSWQGGANSSVSGVGESMWSDQCNLPIYSDIEEEGSYLNLSNSGGCWGGGQNTCDFSAIQRPSDADDIIKACGP